MNILLLLDKMDLWILSSVRQNGFMDPLLLLDKMDLLIFCYC